MIVKIKAFLLLSLSFGLSSMFAIVIDKESIDRSSYFIQIAVLKSSKNIENVKNRLNSYDLLIEDYKNLKKIYVVNIKNRSKLLEIRKIYPTAFIAKKPISSTIKSSKKDNSYNFKGIFEVYDKKRSSIKKGSITPSVSVKKTSTNSANKDILKVDSITPRKKIINNSPKEIMLDLDTILNEKPEGSDLDSKTILKTRKSFL